MNTLHSRIHRAGWALAAAGAAFVVGSCDGGLFVEPAMGPARVVISYSLTEAAAVVNLESETSVAAPAAALAQPQSTPATVAANPWAQ